MIWYPRIEIRTSEARLRLALFAWLASPMVGGYEVADGYDVPIKWLGWSKDSVNSLGSSPRRSTDGAVRVRRL